MSIFIGFAVVHEDRPNDVVVVNVKVVVVVVVTILVVFVDVDDGPNDVVVVNVKVVVVVVVTILVVFVDVDELLITCAFPNDMIKNSSINLNFVILSVGQRKFDDEEINYANLLTGKMLNNIFLGLGQSA